MHQQSLSEQLGRVVEPETGMEDRLLVLSQEVDEKKDGKE